MARVLLNLQLQMVSGQIRKLLLIVSNYFVRIVYSRSNESFEQGVKRIARNTTASP